jgi:hypothetical protein
MGVPLHLRKVAEIRTEIIKIYLSVATFKDGPLQDSSLFTKTLVA